MKQKFLVTLGLIWLLIVTSAYFLLHKPFQPAQAIALLNTMLDVLGVALLVTTAGALGRATLRLWPQPSTIPLGGHLAVEALTGLALIALAVLALSMAGLAHGRFLLTLTVATAALLRIYALAWWQDLFSWLRDGIRRLKGNAARALALFLALMLGLAFLNALAPPVKWDGLVYHLTGPKLYAEAGYIRGDIDNPYFGFPQLTEMLYLWQMTWREGTTGDGSALIHWTFGVLALMLVGTITARRLNAAYGLFAAAILLGGATLWLEFSWPYTDLTATAYTVAAFSLLVHDEDSDSLPLRAGLLAGCALGAKYTSLGAIIGLGLLAMWRMRRDALPFVAGAFLAFAPWLIKNAFLYGNPAYPFFFNAPYWDHWRQAWITRAGTGLLAGKPLHLLILPWDATVCSQEKIAGFRDIAFCTSDVSLGASIGPLLLALIPLLAVGWHTLSIGQRRFAKYAALPTAGAYLVWLLGAAASALLLQTRLLSTAFPMLAILASLALWSIRGVKLGRVRTANIAGGVAALVLALSLVGSVLYSVELNAAAPITGVQSARTYLYDKLGWYYAAMEQVNALPGGGTAVHFLWEPRTFYCRDGIACYPDALLDKWYHAMRIHEGDIYAISEAWREDVTHVLVYEDGRRRAASSEPFLPGDLDALAAFTKTYLAPMWQGTAEDGTPIYTLYTWR